MNKNLCPLGSYLPCQMVISAVKKTNKRSERVRVFEWGCSFKQNCQRNFHLNGDIGTQT